MGLGTDPFYIGKTESQYKCRISQHMGVSARTGNALTVKVASDVRDHCFKCRVHVKAENFSIIDKLHTKNNILALESLH